MLDASGLLWRLSLDGVDTGGRWAALAEAWAAKDPTPWYVFNDLHAIMAFVGAGRQAQAEQRVAQLERYLREGDPGHANHRMVAGAGLAAARAGGCDRFGCRRAVRARRRRCPRPPRR